MALTWQSSRPCKPGQGGATGVASLSRANLISVRHILAEPRVPGRREAKLTVAIRLLLGGNHRYLAPDFSKKIDCLDLELTGKAI